MANEEHHVALPKLYGAPAYARRPPLSSPRPKPFDPDDLPIETYQTDEERELLKELQAETWTAASRATVAISSGGA